MEEEQVESMLSRYNKDEFHVRTSEQSVLASMNKGERLEVFTSGITTLEGIKEIKSKR